MRARISVWLERAAHNRFVLGSNPSGPIQRAANDSERPLYHHRGFEPWKSQPAQDRRSEQECLPPVQIRADPCAWREQTRERPLLEKQGFE